MSLDVDNIIELLGPHEVVGQALEVLMASHDLSRDAAFEMLIEGSCGSHQRMREFAASIVEEAGA
jgi:AmiR/NasT family two-component response regulator